MTFYIPSQRIRMLHPHTNGTCYSPLPILLAENKITVLFLFALLWFIARMLKQYFGIVRELEVRRKWEEKKDITKLVYLSLYSDFCYLNLLKQIGIKFFPLPSTFLSYNLFLFNNSYSFSNLRFLDEAGDKKHGVGSKIWDLFFLSSSSKI